MRELENAIERAAILARGESLEPEDLLLEPAVARADTAGGSQRASETAASSDALAFAKVAGADGTLQDAVDRATEDRVRGALRETSGRRAEAARLLGVERTTLYRLIKRFGIED